MGRPPSGGRTGVARDGPAPGGQSRFRYTRKPSCKRGKLPAGHAELIRDVVSSLMLPDCGGPVERSAKLHPLSSVSACRGPLRLPDAARHRSQVIDSDNESITSRSFQSSVMEVERNHGQASPDTAAGYPRATSRGRRAVAGER